MRLVYLGKQLNAGAQVPVIAKVCYIGLETVIISNEFTKLAATSIGASPIDPHLSHKVKVRLTLQLRDIALAMPK
jgi:hypothetical protein